MLRIPCLCLAFVAATPLWAQVEPSGSGGGTSLDDTQMMTPAPVSGGSYPGTVGSEERTNFLSGGLIFTGAYIDNLLVGSGTSLMSDETYSLAPTISFDRRTPKQDETLSYSSGFTFYQHSSQYNSVAQSALGSYRFHISKYTVVDLRDTFQQNNNLYNQSNPFAGGGISGTPGQSNGIVIAPFENQLNNSSNAGIHYQYGKNAMIGASGSYSFQKYSEAAQVTGLNNEGETAATGYFSRRIEGAHYVGATYEFSKFVTHPFDTYTLTHTVLAFYTHYFTRSFSLSVQGGPEHYITWSSTAPTQDAWTPAAMASFGWQTLRTNVAANYAHIVSGAGGLIGTYHSDTAGLSGRLAISRMWSGGAHVNYALFSNVSSNPAVGYGVGGKSIFGGVYLSRRITDRLNAQANYGHYYQSYPDLSTASTFPNSNRVSISITYQFNRPIGR